MDDKQFIKALEFLSDIDKYKAPIPNFQERIFPEYFKAVLDYINSLKKEISRLQSCVKTEDEVRRIIKETIVPEIKRATEAEVDKVRKETASDILTSLKQFSINRFNYFGKLEKQNREISPENRHFDLGEMDMANCIIDLINELIEMYQIEVEIKE